MKHIVLKGALIKGPALDSTRIKGRSMIEYETSTISMNHSILCVVSGLSQDLRAFLYLGKPSLASRSVPSFRSPFIFPRKKVSLTTLRPTTPTWTFHFAATSDEASWILHLAHLFGLFFVRQQALNFISCLSPSQLWPRKTTSTYICLRFSY